MQNLRARLAAVETCVLDAVLVLGCAEGPRVVREQGADCAAGRVGPPQVLDSNKAVLGVCDIYPSAIEVPAGELTLRAFLRHDDSTLLEKMRHLPMARPLPYCTHGVSQTPWHTRKACWQGLNLARKFSHTEDPCVHPERVSPR